MTTDEQAEAVLDGLSGKIVPGCTVGLLYGGKRVIGVVQVPCLCGQCRSEKLPSWWVRTEDGKALNMPEDALTRI